MLWPGYASPADAIRAPRSILYTIAIYTGTGIQKPDYLVTSLLMLSGQPDLFAGHPPSGNARRR